MPRSKCWLVESPGQGVEGTEGQRGKRMGPLPVVKWGLSWVLEVDPG